MIQPSLGWTVPRAMHQQCAFHYAQAQLAIVSNTPLGSIKNNGE